jgi:RNA polymerase sigma factor (TIGR02999 family)
MAAENYPVCDPETSTEKIVELIEAWRRGDRSAFNTLIPLVYEDLRRRAHGCLGQERDGHTLQTTDLVHEAYLRLVASGSVSWATRGQFLAVAAHIMRQILVDYARSRNALKRGAGTPPLMLTDCIASGTLDSVNILALDVALERLASLDERQARIVELRYFAGLDIEQTARAINVSSALVKKEWRLARAWLYSELSSGQTYDSGTVVRY